MKYLNSINALIKKTAKPALLLVILFFVLLLGEAYILYYKVYSNLSTGINDVVVDNKIVRLDSNSYNKTIDLLDKLNSFTPPSLNIRNPFK